MGSSIVVEDKINNQTEVVLSTKDLKTLQKFLELITSQEHIKNLNIQEIIGALSVKNKNLDFLKIKKLIIYVNASDKNIVVPKFMGEIFKSLEKLEFHEENPIKCDNITGEDTENIYELSFEEKAFFNHNRSDYKSFDSKAPKMIIDFTGIRHYSKINFAAKSFAGCNIERISNVITEEDTSEKKSIIEEINIGEQAFEESTLNEFIIIRPDNYDNYIKIKIGDAAFRNCRHLKYFTTYLKNKNHLRSYINFIGKAAFHLCNLKEINLLIKPENSNKIIIGKDTFTGNNFVTDINITIDCSNLIKSEKDKENKLKIFFKDEFDATGANCRKGCYTEIGTEAKGTPQLKRINIDTENDDDIDFISVYFYKKSIYSFSHLESINIKARSENNIPILCWLDDEFMVDSTEEFTIMDVSYKAIKEVIDKINKLPKNIEQILYIDNDFLEKPGQFFIKQGKFMLPYKIDVSRDDLNGYKDADNSTDIKKEKTNLYILYGLVGPMKRLLLDFVKEYYYDDYVYHVDDDRKLKSHASISSLNSKYVDRYRDVYDEETINQDENNNHNVFEVIKNITHDKSILKYSKNNNKDDFGITYGIRLGQIGDSYDLGKDHFVICNSIEAIEDLRKEMEKEDQEDNRLKNIRHIPIFVEIKENNSLKPIISTIANKLYSKILLEDELKKETERRINSFNENYKKMDQYPEKRESIIFEYDGNYYDNYDKIYDEFREKLLKIVDKNATRFDWRRLISERRILNDIENIEELNSINENDLDPYVYDYDMISSLSSFRRLQDKCQVYPLKRHDYVRTRFTHSIEVAATAEELGEKVLSWLRGDGGKRSKDYYKICRAIPIILRNASLLHDMGNPPFGHFCEDKIRKWFESNRSKFSEFEKKTTGENLYEEFLHFEGNAQMFRLVTTLAKYSDSELNMPNLTISSIAACIKYPCISIKADKENKDVKYHKNGIYASEWKYYKKIANNLGLRSFYEREKNGKKEEATEYYRHPLSFLLEAADDISYLSSDLEDGLKKKYISMLDFEKEIKNLKENLEAKYGDDDLPHVKYVKKMLDIIKKYKDTDNRTTRERYYKIIRRKTKEILIDGAIDSFIKNYDKIMSKGDGNTSYNKELLEDSEYSRDVDKLIRKLLIEHVYKSEELVLNQIKADKVIDVLMDSYAKTAVEIFNNGFNIKDYKDEANTNILLTFSKDYRSTTENLINKENLDEAEKIYKKDCGFYDSSITPDNIKMYWCIQLVLDQLCGMTDSYALEMYQLLTASEKI